MGCSPSAGLKVTFANARGDATHLGPFNRLIFDGVDLKDEDTQLIAHHDDRRWQLVSGARYSRMECYIPCRLSFESPRVADMQTRKVGPFSTLSAIDGVIYGDHRILAFCDSQLRDWYSFDFGQHYRCLIAVPHEEARR